MALWVFVWVNVALLGKLLQICQALALELGNVGIGLALHLPSNALEASTVFFRKRFKVSVENSLPNSFSSSARARLMR